MHPAIPRLLELQAIDQRIASVRADLDSFPKRLRDAESMLNGARAALATAKDAHSNNLKERKKAELDVAQWKERARKYRDQSGAVKTNEAYKALQHEIANAEAEMTKAEDVQLDGMMSGEEFERRVKSAEAALKEAGPSLGAERQGIENRQRGREKKLDAGLGQPESTLSALA